MVGYKDGIVRLFSVVPSGRTRGNEHMLKHRKLCLKVRIYFFIVRETDKLLKEVVKSSSLEIFKSCLDKVLSKKL